MQNTVRREIYLPHPFHIQLKKISILLSLVLIFSFTLIACKGEEAVGGAESSAPAAVVSSEEASSGEESSEAPTSSTEAPKEVT